MTIRARTSPSGGRGGVVVTRRRCERWLPERAMVAGASDGCRSERHRLELLLLFIELK
jgi:hypothetical protein